MNAYEEEVYFMHISLEDKKWLIANHLGGLLINQCCTEEMAELQICLSKFNRFDLEEFKNFDDRRKLEPNLIEEIAHVQFYIDIIKKLHNISDIEILQEQEKRANKLIKIYDI